MERKKDKRPRSECGKDACRQVPGRHEERRGGTMEDGRNTVKLLNYKYQGYTTTLPNDRVLGPRDDFGKLNNTVATNARSAIWS